MKIYLIKPFLTLFIFCLFCGQNGYSQDLPRDLSNVNVDNLSQEQIRKISDKIKSSGLSETQWEAGLKQRGMSSLELSKLKNRINNLPSDQGSSTKNTEKNRLRSSKNQNRPTILRGASKNKDYDFPIFGEEIFYGVVPTFNPSVNVVVPDSYVLGPGDQIIIDVYGASEATYNKTISSSGNIIISGVGPVNLLGLTLGEAKKRVFSKLSNIYYGLRGRNPSTFLQVTVGELKTVKVNVVGNAVQPGSYTLSSFSTAFNALYYAGGPSKSGSMREIVVIRGGKEIAKLDLYTYLFNKDNTQNPTLKDDDIIIVQPYVSRVSLSGEIKQPAIYEIKTDENLQTLLNVSGGFTSDAYKENITIDRKGEKEKKVLTISMENYSSTKLQDGDSISVQGILDKYSNRVKVIGAVNRPNYYEISEGMKLSQLIKLSDGLRKDANKSRGNILRLNEDLTRFNISFDVNAVITGQQDFLLKPNDEVYIASIFDKGEALKITLEGAVNAPGKYPYIQGMKVEDLLNVSGGILYNASVKSVEVSRRIENPTDPYYASKIYTFDVNEDFSLDTKASSFELEPYDLVTVKTSILKQPQKMVKVEGQVMLPGYYALETNEETISSIIKRAGGLTKYAYLEGASLIRKSENYKKDYDQGELQILLEKKKKGLELQFANQKNKNQLIKNQLAIYELELKKKLSNGVENQNIEGKKAKQKTLEQLQKQDSLVDINTEQIVQESESIGINLEEVLNSKKEDDIFLKDGDVISIPKVNQIVRVKGEVLHPASLKYEEGKKLKSYISKSGGFTSKAKIGRTYIVYYNGNAQKTSRFLWFRKFPKVKPGSEILVPSKRQRRRVDVKDILGVTSAVATLALILDRFITTKTSSN